MTDSTAIPRLFALIPCAGSGSRAGTRAPKQYEPIAGRAMVLHTLDALMAVARITRTWVVVAAGDRFFEELTIPGCLVAPCGGATRADSVLNGLQALLAADARPDDWVLVHDAARCLVTPAQIDALIDACLPDAVGGLLALPLADTLKQADGDRATATLPRAGKWLAQTPQMFRIGLLAAALERAGDAVTDEAGAIEAAGYRPRLVPGGAQNFKITYAPDFALAEAVLMHRRAQGAA